MKIIFADMLLGDLLGLRHGMMIAYTSELTLPGGYSDKNPVFDPINKSNENVMLKIWLKVKARQKTVTVCSSSNSMTSFLIPIRYGARTKDVTLMYHHPAKETRPLPVGLAPAPVPMETDISMADVSASLFSSIFVNVYKLTIMIFLRRFQMRRNLNKPDTQ
ncbi:hypothetical protein BX666DRAFT_2031007 [Dichotomocladium elegans]|nr:hypothetical protein BX666DRAFT_2031007 [Dichotomocladium elegans]